MNLPRLITTSNDYSSDALNTVKKIIHPINVSLTLNITPLSYASIKVPKDEKLPQRGLIELFTPYGSAGIFRVRSPQDAYGDEITSAELEHSIAEVGDYLVKEKIDKMMNAETAMKQIFKHYKGKLWKLGTVSALGTGKVAVSVNYGRVLDSMLAILEQKRDCMMAFDFSTSPWTVKIVKKETTVSASGRLSRNVSSAVVSYDDTELCTRVWYETFAKNSKGEMVGTWKSKDASTKSKYGIIEHEISTSSDLTSDEINTIVDTYIDEHKNPRVSVSIEGIELSHITGESMDKLAIGKMYSLVIPEYNVVLEDNIVGLSWGDLYGKPSNVTVNVGDQEDTVVTFLHNLDSKGSGGGGGGGAQKKEEEKWKEYYTEITQTDYRISMNATRVNRANEILEKAGLEINSQGVLIYSEKPKDGLASKFKVLADSITSTVSDAKRELQSEIKQTADAISLVVSGTGSNAKIKPASIVAAINNGSSSIKISADHIELDGHAVAESLDSETISVYGLDCSTGTISSFDCDNKFEYSGSSFKFKGNSVSWKQKQIQTLTMSAFHDFTYNGGTLRGRIITDVSTETIYYLGR